MTDETTVRTCRACATSKPTSAFKYGYRVCQRCRTDRMNVGHALRRDGFDDAERREFNRELARKLKLTNDLSRKTATRLRKPYSPQDMVVLLDPTLSARDVATRLGRTFLAVRNKRQKVQAALGTPVRSHAANRRRHFAVRPLLLPPHQLPIQPGARPVHRAWSGKFTKALLVACATVEKTVDSGSQVG